MEKKIAVQDNLIKEHNAKLIKDELMIKERDDVVREVRGQEKKGVSSEICWYRMHGSQTEAGTTRKRSKSFWPYSWEKLSREGNDRMLENFKCENCDKEFETKNE